MASVMRPAIFRQACSMASTTRALSTQSYITSNAFRTSAAFRTRPLQSAFIPFTSTRIAAFHASGSKAILPPLPQKIQGTLNDPAPVPPTSPSHGSYHWSFERTVAAALVPLTVAPFAAGSLNPVMDSVLIAMIIIHSHIGFEASIVDYFPKWRVPLTRKILDWILRISTVLVAVAFYEFETNDVGVTEAIKKIWRA